MTVKTKKFICVDLGTSKIVISLSDKGVIFNESSKVAYDTRNNVLMCIGNDANALDGKTSDQVKIEQPIVDGIINNMESTKDFLSLVAEKVEIPSLWKDALVLMACPSGVTQLEKASLKQIAIHLGANHVIIKPAAQLAAIGAGIDFYAPKGNLIVDIGNGITDVAVVSAGHSVISKNVKLSGASISREIMLYIRTTYNMLVGNTVIDLIKLKLGCLKDYEPVKALNIFGRDAVSGLPKEVQVSSTEIFQIFKSSFVAVTDLIVDILEKTPADLTYDVIKNGMTIVGGMSKIRGIRDFMEKVFRFKVNLMQDPELAVIKGAEKLGEELPKILQEDKIESINDYKVE